MAVRFKDIDMSPLSPYSGKYAGRLIEKVKRSLDLEYLIEDNRIASQNRIVLDQLSLGKHVDRPDATDLPVGLAVALLRKQDMNDYESDNSSL